MGNSSLTLKAVAIISFVMALEVAEVGRSGAVLLLLSAVVGFGACAGSATLSDALGSRAAMAPWILSASAVASISNPQVAGINLLAL